ncbi:protein of unknown function [Methanoculleus bourgensis]|uniref:Uncharacterized protein n=1 Tax=Methanoculleus bourgensis TaxID=83986 RepID=A0A0X3BIK3_9EURY|nr:protein of unknown function [Methanoculleus bourgensis]
MPPCTSSLTRSLDGDYLHPLPNFASFATSRELGGWDNDTASREEREALTGGAGVAITRSSRDQEIPWCTTPDTTTLIKTTH